VVKIQIEPAREKILIAGMDVYVLPVGRRKPKKAVWDWMTSGRDLRDFVDDMYANCQTESDLIATMISGGEFRYAESDRDEVVKLVELLYERPDMSAVCRRIILKAYGGSSDLERLWAEGIRRVCEGGRLNRCLVDTLWCDYSILSDDAKDHVGVSIWQALGNQTTFHSMISALR
jgi:hypothetical protein